MEGVLLPAFVYLCAALVAVPLAHRVGLGSVLGYLGAGVLIEPGSSRRRCRASPSSAWC